jgi:phosphoribosylanthranilate isomerase
MFRFHPSEIAEAQGNVFIENSNPASVGRDVNPMLSPTPKVPPMVTAMSLRVKICGITNAADAVAAVDAGADALGFMFFENSKRNVSAKTAAEIIRELPPFISKVGVFVDATDEVIRNTIQETGIDAVQLHGEESAEFCARFSPVKVIKAFRIRDRASLEQCREYRAHAWLLDSFVDGAQGGTGVAFDWEVAAEVTKLHRMVILAGGLKVETVAGAVHRVRPFAVDVSSGVESAPVKKDHGKIRAFIAAAKSA